jgi:hypothetical protein
VSACRRFDEEAVPRLESGQALDDPHFADCPECRAARENHERLLGALRFPNRLAPRADWRQRVFAEIDRQAAERTSEARGRTVRVSRGRLWGAVAGLLAAGLAAVFLLPPNRLAPPEFPAGLRQEVVAGATTSRGGGEVARPGDRLLLHGETGGAIHAELRLYWNRDRLVVRCAGDNPPCRREGQRLSADLVLDTRGSYLPLLILAPEPIPAPGSGFDADLAALVAAGGRVEVGREISVR